MRPWPLSVVPPSQKGLWRYSLDVCLLRSDHAPMATFRGAPLTHEAAEEMLIGWMDPARGASPFSWLVAAGKNPVSCLVAQFVLLLLDGF
jgi:hypothetical protein